MKSQSYVVPNALAVTTAVLFVVCRALVGLFPDASYAIAQSWFHGIGINQTGSWDLTLVSFITGLVSITVTAWIIGFIYISASKLFSK